LVRYLTDEEAEQDDIATDWDPRVLMGCKNDPYRGGNEQFSGRLFVDSAAND
jgi:hypothetical protein